MTSPAKQRRSWKSSLLLAASSLVLARWFTELPGFVPALLVAEALAFLAVFFALRSGRHAPFVVLLLAAAGRLAWMGSEPIREDDYFRYLWDGNTVLAGVHPYRYTPHDVLGAMQPEGDLARLDELAREAPDVFARNPLIRLRLGGGRLFAALVVVHAQVPEPHSGHDRPAPLTARHHYGEGASLGEPERTPTEGSHSPPASIGRRRLDRIALIEGGGMIP